MSGPACSDSAPLSGRAVTPVLDEARGAVKRVRAVCIDWLPHDR